MLTRKRPRRGGKGQQLVEVVVGLIALVPVFLLLVDVWFMFIVNALLDTTARDAARAAAAVFPVPLKVGSTPLSGPNKTRAESVVQLAVASLTPTQALYIKKIQLAAARPGTITVTAIPANIDLMGGAPTGSVTVGTELVCDLPVSLVGFGTKVPFRTEATFPLTCTKQGNLNTFVK